MICSGIKLLHPLSFGYGVEVWAACMGERKVVVRRYFGPALTAAPRVVPDPAVLFRIEHPRIQKLLWNGMDEDGTLMQVSNWVEGKSLRSIMGATDADAMVPADFRTFLRDGLEALKYLHSSMPGAPVMHADVSPANMVCGPVQGRVGRGLSLIDVRGARPTDDDTPGSGMNTKLILGSLHFMADEVLRGDPISPAAEIWSLGASILAGLTGRVPWATGTSPDAVLALRKLTPPRDLLDESPATASGIAEVLIAMLERDPSNRPTAEQAIAITG